MNPIQTIRAQVLLIAQADWSQIFRNSSQSFILKTHFQKTKDLCIQIPPLRSLKNGITISQFIRGLPKNTHCSRPWGIPIFCISPPQDSVGLYHDQKLVWTVIICFYKNLEYSVSKDRKLKLINLSSINEATVTVKSNDRWENGEMKQFHNFCIVSIHPQSSRESGNLIRV